MNDGEGENVNEKIVVLRHDVYGFGRGLRG
jgi:hypothetical protein